MSETQNKFVYIEIIGGGRYVVKTAEDISKLTMNGIITVNIKVSHVFSVNLSQQGPGRIAVIPVNITDTIDLNKDTTYFSIPFDKGAVVSELKEDSWLVKEIKQELSGIEVASPSLASQILKK